MTETIKYIPDEIQLQIADDDGMIAREANREVKFQVTQMNMGVDYELIQKEVAEWEGMTGIIAR